MRIYFQITNIYYTIYHNPFDYILKNVIKIKIQLKFYKDIGWVRGRMVSVECNFNYLLIFFFCILSGQIK